VQVKKAVAGRQLIIRRGKLFRRMISNKKYCHVDRICRQAEERRHLFTITMPQTMNTSLDDASGESTIL